MFWWGYFKACLKAWMNIYILRLLRMAHFCVWERIVSVLYEWIFVAITYVDFCLFLAVYSVHFCMLIWLWCYSFLV
jgi:hypothetical protein